MMCIFILAKLRLPVEFLSVTTSQRNIGQQMGGWGLSAAGRVMERLLAASTRME
jgi:hypothetical protein